MRLLTIVAALLVMAGLFCGGEKTPPAQRTTTEQTAAVPAGFPTEAFAELTKAEMDKYVKALPAVGEALAAAGYKSKSKEGGDMAVEMAATIDGMESVAGVEAALKTAGMGWPEFRVTTYKVMSASVAMAMGLAEAMLEGMGGDSAETAAAKAEFAKAKAAFSSVPQRNQQMVIEYSDKLEALDKLDQE